MLMVPKCQTPKVLERNSETLKTLDERSVLTLLLASSESNSGLVSFLTGVGQKSVEAKKTSYKLHRSYWNSSTAIFFFPFYLNKRKLQKYINHNLFDCRVTQLLLLADIEK